MSKNVKNQRVKAFILGVLTGLGLGILGIPFAFALLTMTGWARESIIGGTTFCIMMAEEVWNTLFGIITLLGIVLLSVGILLEVRTRRKLHSES